MFLGGLHCFHVLLCTHSCIHVLYFQVPGQQALSVCHSAADVDLDYLCVAWPHFRPPTPPHPLHFN